MRKNIKHTVAKQRDFAATCDGCSALELNSPDQDGVSELSSGEDNSDQDYPGVGAEA